MNYVFCVVLLLFLLLFLLSRKEKIPDILMKASGFHCFTKSACYLLKHTHFNRLKNSRAQNKIEERLKGLYPSYDGRELLMKYYVEKWQQILLLLFFGTLLSFIIHLSGNLGVFSLKNNEITRGDYGEIAKDIVLVGKTDRLEETFKVKVEPRKLSEEEIEAFYVDFLIQLEEQVLGENSSLDEIRKDMNLMEEIEPFPFTLSWESNNYSRMDSSGKITEPVENPMGEYVSLTAHIKYEEWSRDYCFFIRLMPVSYTDEELEKIKIEEALSLSDQNTKTKMTFKLPEKVGMENVIWSEVKSDGSCEIFLCILIAGVFLYYGKDRELVQKMKAREGEMLSDYPEIITKLSLYMGAGMSIKSSWKKMVEEYDERNLQTKKKRYAYEEMKVTVREMESGISEWNAYYNFGKRCKIHNYLKFSLLLTQNLKKGTNGILSFLSEEASRSFEERKNMARKLGEEAGTKLLIPMMLMLIVVIVIIMVPAFQSFTY